MKVWSQFAIDYSKGIDIYDPVEKKIYTDSEARQAPREIQTRLINKPRVVGCYVEDIPVRVEKINLGNLLKKIITKHGKLLKEIGDG